MINTTKLQKIDGLLYALDEIRQYMKAAEWDAFSRYMQNKPYTLSADGRKCVLVDDFQMYIRLRTNALKKLKEKDL